MRELLSTHPFHYSAACITMQYFHIKVQICLQNCKGLGAVSKDSFLQQAIPLESSRHPPSPLTLGMCNNMAFSWIELDPNPKKGFTVWVIFAECWRPENCVVTVYQYYHLPFLCKTGKKSVQFAKGKLCGDEGKVGRSQIRK